MAARKTCLQAQSAIHPRLLLSFEMSLFKREYFFLLNVREMFLYMEFRRYLVLIESVLIL